MLIACFGAACATAAPRPSEHAGFSAEQATAIADARRRAAQVERSHSEMACDLIAAEEHEREQHQRRAFFASAQWQPFAVAARCAEPGAFDATLEARSIADDAALYAARPQLEHCMDRFGLGESLRLGLAIDARSGAPTGAMVMDQPPDAQRDACVAEALALACFEPVPARTHLFHVFARHAQPDEHDRAARSRLTPVASQCAAVSSAPTAEPPTDAELHDALSREKIEVEACLRDAGATDESVWIAINIDAPSGRVAGVAAVLGEDEALGACLARALASTCLLPFEAPLHTQPYWSTRVPWHVQARPRPHAPAEVDSSCAPSAHTRPRPTNAEIEAALRDAMPAIEACLSAHGLDSDTRTFLALELAGATGGIRSVLAKREPKSAALDACIAAALSEVCVEPFADPAFHARIPLGVRPAASD